MKLVIAALALVGSALLVGAPGAAFASPACTPEVLEDGSLIYAQVYEAKPIKKKPPHIKAILPKLTMGAKMYVYAEKGMTSEYLRRAALCHAASNAPPAHSLDPLRVDGEIRSIRVLSAGSAFVISVLGDDRATGRAIWERAKAVASEVDADYAKRQQADQDL